MKTLFFLFLNFTITFAIQAQCNLEYKPFSSFKNNTEYKSDTIAYLVYNFDQRSGCYKGKTIQDILKDMELPIVNFSYIISYNEEWKERKIYQILFNIKSIHGGKLNSLIDYYISISLQDTISPPAEILSLVKKYPKEKWVPQHYDYFKDIHVEKIKFNPELQERWRSNGDKKL